MTPPLDRRTLVVHVVYRFDIGGLENGVVNLINRMPRERFTHAVVSLTEITDFRKRVILDDVEFIALRKPPGHGVRIYPQLLEVFRRLQPAIVHTRNLAALEATIPAWLARVPIRIHGEHGRDVGDFDATSNRYRWMRRLYSPWVTHYVAVSGELSAYLVRDVGIAPARVSMIRNGVDESRFRPRQGGRGPIAGSPFNDPDLLVLGTVGRLQPVKDQIGLARAFVTVASRSPTLAERLRLVIVGEGPTRQAIEAELTRANLLDHAWLPGERDDIPEILRGLDAFVLPSRSEGISNVLLEAMASGLPIVATDVGGNGELVVNGATGMLVGAMDETALADAIERLCSARETAAGWGIAARARAENEFSLTSMTRNYAALYDRLLASGKRDEGAALRAPAKSMPRAHD